jgi:mono/diheme cytochrome c family protein
MMQMLIVSAALLAAIPAWAQKDLPDGAGKQTTTRVCTSCHGAEMFSAVRLGKTEWDAKVANMTTERGVAITDADYAAVVKYLATYLAPAPKAEAK